MLGFLNFGTVCCFRFAFPIPFSFPNDFQSAKVHFDDQQEGYVWCSIPRSQILLRDGTYLGWLRDICVWIDRITISLAYTSELVIWFADATFVVSVPRARSIAGAESGEVASTEGAILADSERDSLVLRNIKITSSRHLAS